MFAEGTIWNSSSKNFLPHNLTKMSIHGVNFWKMFIWYFFHKSRSVYLGSRIYKGKLFLCIKFSYNSLFKSFYTISQFLNTDGVYLFTYLFIYIKCYHGNKHLLLLPLTTSIIYFNPRMQLRAWVTMATPVSMATHSFKYIRIHSNT